MQKSFIERVFPKPKQAILPQYDSPSVYQDEPQARRSERATSISNASDSRSPARSLTTDRTLQPAPLSASIIHHEDPFIAVDRAAQTLQRTIQSLLDFQSEILGGRHQGDIERGSQSDLTPARSTSSRSAQDVSLPGAIPVRQPAKRKPTLKRARRGIEKSMREFATLKEEELKITADEQAHRKTALDKIVQLQTKRESVEHEIDTLQKRASGDESNTLRQEAETLQGEIDELGGRLMELKAKHRHLTNRAEQLENTAASELSSYQGALILVDKEVKHFLRRPPVKQSLSPRNLQHGQDMYSLRPERRTLELAREQWTAEIETLEQHKAETERERDALVEGAKMWGETVQKIDDFEKTLRARMKTSVSETDSTSDILSSLDATMHSLENSLSQAETKDWKLLICAMGPELESFRQARSLLAPEDSQNYDSEHMNGTNDTQNTHTGDDDGDVPHADLLGEQPTSLSVQDFGNQKVNQDEHTFPTTTSSSTSNESLKATLKSITSGSARQTVPFTASTSSGKLPEHRETRYAESEDDDPGPDFLLSR